MRRPASLVALSFVLGACSGSAASDEELRAADLIFGAKDKASIQGQGTLTQKSASPATFTITTPVATGDILTVTKLGACKYQSLIDLGTVDGSVYKLTVDLIGLLPDGLEKAQQASSGLRLLTGASVTCELVANGTPRTDGPTMPRHLCEVLEKPATVPMFTETADLDALATRFKADFCQ